jgi:hypothetical protein
MRPAEILNVGLFPDTLEGMWTTELAIREVEQKVGFSASNSDFLETCRS